jgi:hypothetical protein
MVVSLVKIKMIYKFPSFVWLSAVTQVQYRKISLSSEPRFRLTIRWALMQFQRRQRYWNLSHNRYSTFRQTKLFQLRHRQIMNNSQIGTIVYHYQNDVTIFITTIGRILPFTLYIFKGWTITKSRQCSIINRCLIRRLTSVKVIILMCIVWCLLYRYWGE